MTITSETFAKMWMKAMAVPQCSMSHEKRLAWVRMYVDAARRHGKIRYETMAEFVRWLRRLECQTQATN